LIHRDYASVMKDILEPSAAINPDHLAYQVEFTDGDFRSAIIVKETAEEIVLAEASGLTTSFPRNRIKSTKPAAVSLMPEGLLNALSAKEQKDLLTFLLTEPPEKR